jgi:hypothetical protein
MTFTYHDGGRAEAGLKGEAGDCVARAIAIVTQKPYVEVYARLAIGNLRERKTGGKLSGRRTARAGIHTSRQWFKDYMKQLGFVWTPTMGIGTGCRVHLADGELPMGRLVVAVSRHVTAVIDGVIYDTYDPQREGETVYGHPPVIDPIDGQLRNPIIHIGGGRCVYGYWRLV